jgi:hypothetical protein
MIRRRIIGCSCTFTKRAGSEVMDVARILTLGRIPTLSPESAISSAQLYAKASLCLPRGGKVSECAPFQIWPVICFTWNHVPTQ